MKLADLKARIARDLLAAWQADAEMPDETMQRWLDDGIPADWAEQFAALFASVPADLWPKVLHPPKLLHKRLRSSRMNVDMHADQRLAISKGQGGDVAFRKAIRAKGYTQNGLARAVGVSPAVLSLHRNSLRRIPRARAEAIAKLTGWPADAKHWPCGIASDGE